MKMTRELNKWLNKEVRKFYEDNGFELCKANKILNYKRINDLDYPGIKEFIEFEMMDGRRFKAAFFHNDHYKKLEEVR